MSLRRQFLVVVLAFLALFGVWMVAEADYARRISPQGILTIGEFFDRFGEPRAVRMVESGGTNYYEFTGRQSAPLDLIIPSAPPAYIFDEQGSFVTWSKDPGDDRRHRQRWPLQSTNRVAVWTLKQKFSAQTSGPAYAILSDGELSRLKDAAIQAAASPETWQRLGGQRITKTPFKFNRSKVEYHLYFDHPESLDLLIPSGGKLGWHPCFVRVTIRRDTYEVIGIEESCWL